MLYLLFVCRIFQRKKRQNCISANAFIFVIVLANEIDVRRMFDNQNAVLGQNVEFADRFGYRALKPGSIRRVGKYNVKTLVLQFFQRKSEIYVVYLVIRG